MLKIAILYEDDKIYIEFSPEKFRELLKKYFETYNDVGKSLDEIIKEIKKETVRK